MTSLGFLTIHRQQEIEYITEIAKRAEIHGINIFRFTPFCINPVDELINGEYYDSSKGKWMTKTFEIPPFIYDRCFYKRDSLSKKAKPIVNWLKDKPNVTFLGYGLSNKWEVYETLRKDPYLSAYLPPTYKIHSINELISCLSHYPQVLLKPDSGSQGRGIIRISQGGQKVKAAFHSKLEVQTVTSDSMNEFTSWIEPYIIRSSYLLQPYLQIREIEGGPCDVRLLLQKERTGTWYEVGRGVRKGKSGAIVTNVSHGADILPFAQLIGSLPDSQKKFLCDEIDSVCEKIPKVLEAHFPPLFELGVDLCISKDGGIWILDINSKPGRKTVLETAPCKEESLYNNPLSYCLFLESITTEHCQ